MNEESELIVGVIAEQTSLTVEQLAAACHVSREWVLERVRAGLLPCESQPAGETPRLPIAALVRAQRMHRIERDFEAVPELAALMADTLEELDRLRALLR